MSDRFDPNFYLRDEDPDEEAIARLLREGTETLEQLGDQPSFAKLAEAVGKLSDNDARSTLILATISFKRSQGMTEDEFRQFVLSDLSEGQDDSSDA